MVRGLDLFRETFAAYTDQYLLIGGTAASLTMEDAGLQFRATKDLEIVLHVEVLTPAFGAAFWQFVNAGGYSAPRPATSPHRPHQAPVAQNPASRAVAPSHKPREAPRKRLGSPLAPVSLGHRSPQHPGAHQCAADCPIHPPPIRLSREGKLKSSPALTCWPAHNRSACSTDRIRAAPAHDSIWRRCLSTHRVGATPFGLSGLRRERSSCGR